jgi:hypothetical protein
MASEEIPGLELMRDISRQVGHNRAVLQFQELLKDDRLAQGCNSIAEYRSRLSWQLTVLLFDDPVQKTTK